MMIAHQLTQQTNKPRNRQHPGRGGQVLRQRRGRVRDAQALCERRRQGARVDERRRAFEARLEAYEGQLGDAVATVSQRQQQVRDVLAGAGVAADAADFRCVTKTWLHELRSNDAGPGRMDKKMEGTPLLCQHGQLSLQRVVACGKIVSVLTWEQHAVGVVFLCRRLVFFVVFILVCVVLTRCFCGLAA